jgi:hypothetical protein
MPLMTAAIAAAPDDKSGTVRFLMNDGTKPVVVLVSHAVLEDRTALADGGGYVHQFKQHRKFFEQMASYKYDKGYVEADGTVCIRLMDLPLDTTD